MDIQPLAWAFVEEFSASMGKRIETVSRQSMDRLLSYTWPGNVRELRNIIEYSMILTTGPKLEIVMPHIRPDTVVNLTLRDADYQRIQEVLKLTKGRIRGTGGAAELLGLKESTLRFRMKKLGIKVDR